MTERSPVGSLPDLLAAVPYLLGFHPADSLVVVGARDRVLCFAARADLPDHALGEAASYVTEVCARQPIQWAVLIGYGPAERVEPPLFALREAMERHGLPVPDVLRVTAGRYWSYCCDDPGCCDPAGTPFDPAASPVPAAATYAGAVALPDRAALVARLAPVDGQARAVMDRATVRAEERLLALAGPPSLDRRRGWVVLGAGIAAVRRALERHTWGVVLTEDEAAWLCVLLRASAVRDAAWRLTRPDPLAHLGLWVDVVRRAGPSDVAPPASLVALTAWCLGDGAFAAVAVERALADDPSYPLAVLVAEALRCGLPPSAVDSVGGLVARGAPAVT